MKKVIPSVEEMIKARKPLRNANAEHRERLSGLEKFAVWITGHIGTMGFFLIILIWTAGWLCWNIFGPDASRFDPYPAFVLWLFLSNLIQLHLMPLLLIGQNIQGKHAELRSEHDFETDKKAELEIEAILFHLENQQKIILEILKKIENLEEKKK